MTRTTSMALALALAVASPLAAPLVPGASVDALAGTTDNRVVYRLSRAGSSRGAYCAFYKGRNEFEEFPLAQSISRRACFPTRKACRSWFYQVQSAFPRMSLRKPCRRS